jgi:hypothetical protein
MRKVRGKKYFFHAAQPDGRVLYEMSFPGLGMSGTTAQKWPKAKVIRTWRNWSRQVVSVRSAVWLQGLFWDEERHGLWWNYAAFYNVAGKNDPCFGFTELGARGPVMHGPWRVEGDGANSHRCQGGLTLIPAWFASRYTAGKRLGLGFGGIVPSAAASYGPALFAARRPGKSVESVRCQALLNFPPPKHFCIRDGKYETNIPWGKDPKGGVGFWSMADTINGAGIWIDLPDAHGVLFFPHLGHGMISYVPGGRAWEGATSDVFVFDPKDLAAVARGKVQAWDVKPAQMARFPYVGYKDGSYSPMKGDAARAVYARGCCLDREARMLFVLVSESYLSQGSYYPLVHAFRIR